MISLFIMFTAAYIAGVCMVMHSDFGFALIFPVCMILVTGVFCVLKSSYKRLLCSCFLLLGVLLMSKAWYYDSQILCRYDGRYTEVCGVVTEIPKTYDEYYSYTVKLEEINYKGDSVRIRENIRVTSKMHFATGNRLKLRGFITGISGPDNSTEFDYRNYYKSMGVTYAMHADEAELVTARAFVLSPAYIGNYIKSRIAFAVNRYYKGDSAGLMAQVLLGDGGSFSEEFRDTLIKTSASRFLHPAYLHMILLMSLCELCMACVSRKRRDTALMLVLIAYALINSGFGSFVRIAVMTMITVFYKKVRGFSHKPNIIAITVLTLLIANPMLITMAWFVLSVSFGILHHYFCRPVSERLVFIRNRRLRSAMAVWISCSLGLIPVCAYFYSGVPLYSIIFMLAYTPMTLLLFLTAPFSLLFGELFGNMGVFGAICDAVIDFMKRLPRIVALLPGYYINIGKPGILELSIYISLLVMLRQYLQRGFRGKMFKVSACICAILLCGRAGVYLSERGDLYAYFVNVGQGDGAVINIKGKDTILIDGGGGSAIQNYNVGKKVYLPYLEARGVHNIDLAIVSHSHRDHIEGIIAAIENCNVDTVLLPDIEEKGSYREKIIQAARQNNTNVIVADEGDRLDFDSGLVIEVFSPKTAAKIDDENDASLVLKLTYGETTMFFGGDAGAEVENGLCASIGQVDVVKASHHGSRYSSEAEFVNEVKPEYVVFSAGKNNTYGHPSSEALENYASTGAQILRTDTMGDIIFRADKNRIKSVTRFKEESQWQ